MKIAVIYLAAGSGRRFGANKLLCPLEGKPLFLHGLEKLIRVCSRREDCKLCVVTRHEEILDLLKHFPVDVVNSPDSEKGIGWSVRAGMEWMERAERPDLADACAFFVGDQPYLSEQTMEQFLEQMEQERAELGCVCSDGHMGNPTWFSAAYFSQLKALDGDVGGRKILKQNPERLCRYPVEHPQELRDIDFLEELFNCLQSEAVGSTIRKKIVEDTKDAVVEGQNPERWENQRGKCAES